VNDRQLDSFEAALLTRLRARVEHPPPVPAPGLGRPGTRLLLTAAATIAAAAAAVVVAPGLGPTAAYSVQEGNAGSITVEVMRLEDAEGLEAALAEYGISADVSYVPDEQECADGRYTPVTRSLRGMQVSIGSELLRVTLPPGAVRDGETFVLAVSGTAIPAGSTTSEDGIRDREGLRSWMDVAVAAGPVQPCRVVPDRMG
jgi:hypothetical protein